MLDLISSFFVKYISQIAFFLSLINFVYIYHSSKANLKVKFDLSNTPSTDENNCQLIFNCYFCNKSKYSITISKMKLNNCCIYHNSILLGDGYETIFGQQVYESGNTQQLPFKLESFDSLDSYLLVKDEKLLRYHLVNILKVYTSRGVMYYLKFNFNLKQQPKK